MIEVIINGVKIKVEEGTKILRAARMNSFNIPTLCEKEICTTDEDVINNRCGVCVVQVTINRESKLVPSCCTVIEDKMIVNTLCKSVINERRLKIQSLKSW